MLMVLTVHKVRRVIREILEQGTRVLKVMMGHKVRKVIKVLPGGGSVRVLKVMMVLKDCKGHQGNAGAQGDDGAQGAQGHQGDTGTGNTGAQGADGAQGSPGSGSNNTDSQVTWTVTANGSSAYTFTGPGNDAASDNNPDLYLVRGQRYTFTNNSGGSHPFQIRSSPGGSAYNDGVSNNGASSGNIVFNVQHDAPGTLFYQCTSHGGMVGKIIILGDAIISGTFSASAGSAQTIDATPIVSVSTVEYTVYIENGTNSKHKKF